MRIIHTADWHLCDRLGRIDRTDDLRGRVERVAALCEEHAADVLLIAGDLFSEQAPLDEMTDALTHLHARRSPVLRPRRHDPRAHRQPRPGRADQHGPRRHALAAPAAGRTASLPGGRMYLLNGRAVGTLRDRGRRPGAVRPDAVPDRRAATTCPSDELPQPRKRRTGVLHGRVAGLAHATCRRGRVRPDACRPCWSAHLHVRGAECHTAVQAHRAGRRACSTPAILPRPGPTSRSGTSTSRRRSAGCTRPLPRQPRPARLRRDARRPRRGAGRHRAERADAVTRPAADPGRRRSTRSRRRPGRRTARRSPRQYPDRDTAIVRVTVDPPAGGPSRDEITRAAAAAVPAAARDDVGRAGRAGAATTGPGSRRRPTSPRRSAISWPSSSTATRTRTPSSTLAETFLDPGGAP